MSSEKVQKNLLAFNFSSLDLCPICKGNRTYSITSLFRYWVEYLVASPDVFPPGRKNYAGKYRDYQLTGTGNERAYTPVRHSRGKRIYKKQCQDFSGYKEE